MEHVDVVVVGAGQAGLATAYALVGHGLKPVVLEASDRSAGSWPRYYDSLTLFSPARFSSLPGVRPHRAPSAHSADPAGLRHRRIPSRRRRRPGRRPLFTSIAGKRVVWSDGVQEEVGAIVLATGYRPDLPYLKASASLTAADARCIATASPLSMTGLRSWGWSVSAASRRTRCARARRGSGRSPPGLRPA
ncbi:FAD-dependent oxidoreductase [Streptomyces sp. Isolate_45]|uniref:FAD-dependent oxidoreductase n=1 Tax=Streptomyces sp. Isolate_45 TaxID=2950111 RepID=UPI0024820FF4|nr:FAD-dependent oxidoreductase [Streptomyces sp. Isolate_45]MDA5286599.1 FAD-dependent oxidoreductase [Streptomyces sp. Isolate_45]